jgi:hypothetical protein
MDQYKNPHESKHTAGEVKQWLESTNFTFVNSIPKTYPFAQIDESEKLFKSSRFGNPLERFAVSLGMIISGHKEGGFFTIIGKKSKST